MRLPRTALAAVLALTVAAALAAPPALAGGGPAETVVLVNADSPDSRRVGERYASARQIPPSQVLEVRCTASLDVPMAAFVRDVADPLREFLRARGLEDRVRFVVMTQGMPIRARTGSGDVSTAAALALLHTPLCGARQPGVNPPLRSPAYRGGLPIPPNVETPRFLHVTALLSTTADEAIALVDRSVASDGTAPRDALFLFQDANGNAGTRNSSYDAARREIEALGVRTEKVPAGADKATGRKRVMGYIAGGSYSGLTAAGVATNEYLPGALCDHLQSFGAVPQNFDPDATRHSQFPVTHMVRAGVTGVHGAVAEPFTIAFPDPDLFTAYVQGATLAETFSARLPIAYWMNLVLGDPLCAPYAVRPRVEVASPPRGPWSGDVRFSAKAAGAKRIAVYVDGREVAAADGPEIEASVDTRLFPDGPRHVLVQATGAGAWEPRGWTVVPAAFSNPGLRVAERPVRFGPVLRVPLSRAPAAGENPSLAVESGGAPVAGRSSVDGAALVFEPAAPLPAGGAEAVVTGLGDPVRWRVVPAAAKAEAQAPATPAAGEEFAVRALLTNADGSPAGGWRGRIDVRTDDPPVRIASLDAEAGPDGSVVVPARFTRSGKVALRVTLPDDGVEASVGVSVAAGPPHHATTPLNRVPLGQPTDVDVVVEDAFGNRAESFEGDLRLEIPGDPAAAVPGPVRVGAKDRGRAVFRDVVFSRAGPQGLVISDGAGKRLSLPSEGVEAQHAALRTWLVTTPFRGNDAARAFDADPAPDADRDGGVAGGRLLRRVRSRTDDVALGVPGLREGDAVAAVTFLRALAPTKVRLLGAATGRIVVRLDGKPVYDGTPKAADAKGGRDALCEVTLAEGRHRLSVAVARKGAPPSLSIEIDDGAGKHADTVLADAAWSSGAPSAFVASGRVRIGKGGAGGVRVTVKGADGAERTTESGPDGTWFVAGLPAGRIDVRAEGRLTVTPAARQAEIADGHVTDLDFAAADKTPPTVRLDGLPPRFGRRLVVEPAAEDEDDVRDVRLLVDGVEVAQATAAPWRLEADVTARARGKHEIVVVAADPSGNQARSAPATITLVDDTKGPVVKVSGLANNAVLSKKVVLTAAVTDDLPVASVRFRLDGKDLGEARTTAPYTAEIAPAGLPPGAHAVSVVARDLDGNETVLEVKFRVK